MEKKMSSIIFNSPVEVGLRLLVLLKHTTKSLDMQRLIYYNYFLIHSSDVPESPRSLHPDLPGRACEILVNRKIVKKGIYILLSKGLINVKYTKQGIKYIASKDIEIVFKKFESEYARELSERAKWVFSTFDTYSDKKLSDYMNKHLGKWGSEFSRNYTVLEQQNA